MPLVVLPANEEEAPAPYGFLALPNRPFVVELGCIERSETDRRDGTRLGGVSSRSMSMAPGFSFRFTEDVEELASEIFGWDSADKEPSGVKAVSLGDLRESSESVMTAKSREMTGVYGERWHSSRGAEDAEEPPSGSDELHILGGKGQDDKGVGLDRWLRSRDSQFAGETRRHCHTKQTGTTEKDVVAGWFSNVTLEQSQGRRRDWFNKRSCGKNEHGEDIVRSCGVVRIEYEAGQSGAW